MDKNEDNTMKTDMKKEPPKNRRSLRRNKKKKHSKKMVLVGVNAAGISSKLDSFDDMLTEVEKFKKKILRNIKYLSLSEKRKQVVVLP